MCVSVTTAHVTLCTSRPRHNQDRLFLVIRGIFLPVSLPFPSPPLPFSLSHQPGTGLTGLTGLNYPAALTGCSPETPSLRGGPLEAGGRRGWV